MDLLSPRNRRTKSRRSSSVDESAIDIHQLLLAPPGGPVPGSSNSNGTSSASGAGPTSSSGTSSSPSGTASSGATGGGPQAPAVAAVAAANNAALTPTRRRKVGFDPFGLFNKLRQVDEIIDLKEVSQEEKSAAIASLRRIISYVPRIVHSHFLKQRKPQDKPTSRPIEAALLFADVSGTFHRTLTPDVGLIRVDVVLHHAQPRHRLSSLCSR